MFPPHFFRTRRRAGTISELVSRHRSLRVLKLIISRQPDILDSMDKPAEHDRGVVDEVEKTAAGDSIALDKKLTRSVLWKLDTR